MKADLPEPKKRTMIYKDEKLYACLASHPIARGHVVVVWRRKVKDLHLLSNRDYDYLMDTVGVVREAMLKTLKIQKVYLVYMDEVRHVHWHLIPRYNKKGYDVFKHNPGKLTDISLAEKVKQNLKF